MSGSRQVAILAGGLATRLGRRAEAVPKLLLPVAGRPFAAWLLDRLQSNGIDEVVLCIGHLGEAIRRWVGDGSRFGLRVCYSDEGSRLLGTAGALRLAMPLLEERFIVTYGDSYLPFDYGAVLRDLEAHPAAAATLAVYRNDNRLDRSNLRVAGDHVIEYRKVPPTEPPDPALRDIDYGAMALRREVLDRVPPGQPYRLEELQAELARCGLLRALPVQRRFFEIGSEAGLAMLEAELSAHRSDHPNRGLPPPRSP